MWWSNQVTNFDKPCANLWPYWTTCTLNEKFFLHDLDYEFTNHLSNGFQISIGQCKDIHPQQSLENTEALCKCMQTYLFLYVSTFQNSTLSVYSLMPFCYIWNETEPLLHQLILTKYYLHLFCLPKSFSSKQTFWYFSSARDNIQNFIWILNFDFLYFMSILKNLLTAFGDIFDGTYELYNTQKTHIT